MTFRFNNLKLEKIMGNCNHTHCVVIGKKNDVKVVYDLFKKYEESKNPYSGFVPLISLVEGMGSKVNPDKFLTTYKIHKLSEDGTRLDFYLQGRRGHPYFELNFLENYFKGIKLYYLSCSECCNYITNDKCGHYIKTKFIVDYLGEVHLKTWDEVFDTVGQILVTKITSKEQLFQLLENVYESDPDSEQITVTEVKIV